MRFEILKEKEFKKIENNFELSTYYQTVAWANLKKITNWQPHYIAVKKDKKIVAAALLLSKNILGKYKLFYSPRGLMLDYNDNELLTFFVSELKKYIKSKKGFALKIDPCVEYTRRDNETNVIEDKNINKIVKDLKKLGFHHYGFTKEYTKETQYRWTYYLDVDKSWEELKKNMNQRCKRCINKQEKYPLVLVDVTEDNIKDFKNIMEHTSIRQNHFDRSLEYYKKLQEVLEDRIKLNIIYLDKKKFLKEHKDDKLYDLIKEENQDMIPISAGVFIEDKEYLHYVYGGTYSNYMPLMAQYKIHVEMINYAKEKNIKTYDFGGISGSFDKSSPYYGIFDFKRGFGGYIVEYIGEFDLLINKPMYYTYNIMLKAYQLLRKIKSKIKR